MNKTSELSAVTKSASGEIRTRSITPFSFVIIACAELVFLTGSRSSFFWTLQGDKFLDSYAGSVGLRIDS